MSLDVSLYVKESITQKSTGVFIREDGRRRELTMAEVMEKWPDAEVEEQEEETECVFDANITHNLGKMAAEAGIYKAIWRPEEIPVTRAWEIIPTLESGYSDMKARPDHYKQFNASNGWGVYDDFLPWVKRYLDACREYPEAEIYVSR